MNFLAIDTSTDICSICLYINNEIIDSSDKLVDSTHSKLLATDVDLIIKNNKIKFNDLDFLVLSIGPGSYSGLRVGSSFIKGLGYAIEKEVIPINTIHSMNLELNFIGSYYVGIFSHRDYMFYQEFLNGEPVGEQACDRVSNLKSIKIFGYGLDKISNIDYTEVKPSSISLVNYLIKNYDILLSNKKHISNISPIYLAKKT